MWVTGIESESSVRGAGALNCQVLFPQGTDHSLFHTNSIPLSHFCSLHAGWATKISESCKSFYSLSSPLEPACSEQPELLLQGKYYQSFSVALAALEKSQHQMSQILNKGGPARLERVTSVLSQAPPSPDTHSFFSGLGIPLPLPPLLCPVSLINSPVFRHCPHRILLALRSS